LRGGGRCEAGGVGGDVVDGVGCGRAGVDLHGACFDLVDVGRDAEVELMQITKEVDLAAIAL
jgi:hypothetical protein